VPVEVAIVAIVEIETIYIFVVRPTARAASLLVILLLDVMGRRGFLELCHVVLRPWCGRKRSCDIGRLSYENLSHGSSISIPALGWVHQSN